VTWRAQWLRELALATSAMTAGSYVSIGVAALVPFIRLDLPLSGPEIGALASTPWLTAAVFSLPAATFVDRVGPAIAAGCSQLVIAAGAVTIGLAPTIPVLFLGVALYGLGFGVLNPASSVLSTGTVSPRHRGLAMGIKHTGVSIGGSIAGLTLPGIAAVSSWRVAMVFTVVFLCAVAWWGISTRTTHDRRPLVLAGGVVEIERSRLAFFAFVMSGTQLVLFTYTAVYLVDEVRLSPQLAGIGLTVVLAAGMVGRLLWGAVSDRSGDRIRVLRLTAWGSALVLLLLPFAPGPVVWPALLAVGLGIIGWNGAFLALVAESAGARGVGRATSSVYTFVYGGSIALPPLFGFVFEATSWGWFWALAALGAGVSGLALRHPPVRAQSSS
jgi:MFS family permease